MTQVMRDEKGARISVMSSFMAIAFVALCWVLLFKLNDVFFASIGFSTHISWIFLPAAIRMLSVLVFEWVGALGLFFGALVTSDLFSDVDFSTALALSTMSALGPVVAIEICSRWLGLSRTLRGLGPRQICLFALVGAIFNVIPHNIYLYGSGLMSSPFEGLVPMFVGDLAGTAIVIYLTSLILKLVLPARA